MGFPLKEVNFLTSIRHNATEPLMLHLSAGLCTFEAGLLTVFIELRESIRTGLTKAGAESANVMGEV